MVMGDRGSVLSCFWIIRCSSRLTLRIAGVYYIFLLTTRQPFRACSSVLCHNWNYLYQTAVSYFTLTTGTEKSHNNQNNISQELQRNPLNFVCFLSAANTGVEILQDQSLSQLAGKWTYRILASERTEYSQVNLPNILKWTYWIFASEPTEYSQVNVPNILKWTYWIFASEPTEYSQVNVPNFRKWTYRIFAGERTEYSEVNVPNIHKWSYRIFASERTEYSQVNIPNQLKSTYRIY
jgi:hypothetical protein